MFVSVFGSCSGKQSARPPSRQVLLYYNGGEKAITFTLFFIKILRKGGDFRPPHIAGADGGAGASLSSRRLRAVRRRETTCPADTFSPAAFHRFRAVRRREATCPAATFSHAAIRSVPRRSKQGSDLPGGRIFARYHRLHAVEVGNAPARRMMLRAFTAVPRRRMWGRKRSRRCRRGGGKGRYSR